MLKHAHCELLCLRFDMFCLSSTFSFPLRWHTTQRFVKHDSAASVSMMFRGGGWLLDGRHFTKHLDELVGECAGFTSVGVVTVLINFNLFLLKTTNSKLEALLFSVSVLRQREWVACGCFYFRSVSNRSVSLLDRPIWRFGFLTMGRCDLSLLIYFRVCFI